MRISGRDRDETRGQGYSHAEFALTQPKIFYQFKVRNSASEPLYAVVKEGSRALAHIKAGDVVPMRYYSADKTVPVQTRNTKIKYITKDTPLGFRDHYVIGLCIEAEKSVA